MPIDLSLVVQEAFAVLKDDADKISQTSLSVKSQKMKVEEITRLMLEHLCEMDLIDINLDKLAQTSLHQAGKFANHATIALPANQTERLALEINEASPDDLEKVCHYFSRETRRRLLNILDELDR